MTNSDNEKLIQVIKDENNSVKKRKNAILKLSRFDHPEIDKILNFYSGSDHEVIRFYARWALKKREGSIFIPKSEGAETIQEEPVSEKGLGFDEDPDSKDEFTDETSQDLVINRTERSGSVSSEENQPPKKISSSPVDQLPVAENTQGTETATQPEESTDSEGADKVSLAVNHDIFNENEINLDQGDSNFKFPEKFKLDINDFDNLQKSFWEEFETETTQSKIIYKIRMASELEDRTYIAPLIYLLQKTDDEHVVATVISALGIFNDSKYTELVSAYLSYPDDRVIANSIEALGEIGDKASIETILPFINSDDNRIKANTAKAPYKFDTELVLDIIEGMIESSSVSEKRSAVHALGCMTDQRSLALLKRLLAQDNPDISAEAAELINKIEEKIRIKKERTAKYRAIVKGEKSPVKDSGKKDKSDSRKKRKSASGTLNLKKYAGLAAVLIVVLGLAGGSAGIYLYYPHLITENIESAKRFIDNNMKDLEERDLSVGGNVGEKSEKSMQSVKNPDQLKQSSGVSAPFSETIDSSKEQPQTKSPIQNEPRDPKSYSGIKISSSDLTGSKVITTGESGQQIKAGNGKIPSEIVNNAPAVNKGNSGEQNPNNRMVKSEPEPIEKNPETPLNQLVEKNVDKSASATDKATKDTDKPDKTAEQNASTIRNTVSEVKPASDYFSTSYLEMISEFSIKVPDNDSERKVLKYYLDMINAYNQKDLAKLGNFYADNYKYADNNKQTTLETVKEEFNFGPGIKMKIEKINISVKDTIADVDFVYYLEGSAGDGFEIEKDFSLTARKDQLRLKNNNWIITKSE